MKNKNILISGAGIAGLTLAYWLKQYGFTPTIVEKHPTLRSEGYKIDIRGPAINILKLMRVHEKVVKSRTMLRESIYTDESGKLLKRTHPDLCGTRADGDIEIVRGCLCQILSEQVNEVEYLFDDSIINIAEDEKGAFVKFEKNTPRYFDLVIGADGLHSRVRKLVFGNESQFLRELGMYVSYYSIPNFLDLDRVEIEYHSPRTRRYAVAYCTRDGNAKAAFAFSAPPPQMNLRDQHLQKKFLKEMFTNAGWKIPDLLGFMEDAPDFFFDCMAQVHMPHWTKGRVALAGDAAYSVTPVSGQGTSVALVGAFVLAGELAEANGDYLKAFPQYEKLLQDFVKENQDLVKMTVVLMESGHLSWIISILVRLGHQLGRIMPGNWIEFWKKQALKRTTKAANAIRLKDYSKYVKNLT